MAKYSNPEVDQLINQASTTPTPLSANNGWPGRSRSSEFYAALVSLQRGVNRLVWSLRRAHEVVMGDGVPEE